MNPPTGQLSHLDTGTQRGTTGINPEGLPGQPRRHSPRDSHGSTLSGPGAESFRSGCRQSHLSSPKVPVAVDSLFQESRPLCTHFQRVPSLIQHKYQLQGIILNHLPSTDLLPQLFTPSHVCTATPRPFCSPHVHSILSQWPRPPVLELNCLSAYLAVQPWAVTSTLGDF